MADYDAEFERGKALLLAQLENDRRLALFKSVLDLAAVALNASLLVNGGATVAMLAFIGSAKADGGALDLHRLVTALTWFSIGVAAALIATGVAYVTQAKYARDLSTEISLENRIVAIIIFFSYVAFVGGSIIAADAFRA
jgi:bacteriorhodopsin